MKKYFKILLIVTLLFSLFSFTLHKYYVSVTQIDYVAQKNRVEISTRIFIDDLDKALEKKYKKKVNLASDREIEEAEDLVKKYLSERLQVVINKQVYPLIYLGKEVDDDVYICYYKIDFSEKITTFEFLNSCLTEIFPDQQNMVHMNINSSKKSFLLTVSEKAAILKF